MSFACHTMKYIFRMLCLYHKASAKILEFLLNSVFQSSVYSYYWYINIFKNLNLETCCFPIEVNSKKILWRYLKKSKTFLWRGISKTVKSFYEGISNISLALKISVCLPVSLFLSGKMTTKQCIFVKYLYIHICIYIYIYKLMLKISWNLLWRGYKMWFQCNNRIMGEKNK